MIKNIIFDMGNVLFSYDPDQIVNQLISEPDEQRRVANAIFHSQGWRQLDQGVISYAAYYQHLAVLFPEHKNEINWILNNWDKQTTYISGMYAVIKHLNKLSYDLYILSNANQRYLERQKHLEIFQFFKGITLSSEVKLLKPDIEIFRKFCDIHQLEPLECLFIDDQPENVHGARQAGWDAHHFISTENLKTHLQRTMRISFD